MQTDYESATFLVGDSDTIEAMLEIPALNPFDDAMIVFFDALSKRLLSSPEVNKYPDVAAYAFWIRRKSLEKARDEYDFSSQRLGRGLSFHIAPSNIPVLFAVSMTYALIAGNACIVRASNKDFPQVDLIIRAINHVLSQGHRDISQYICIIRYDRDSALNEHFSSICDTRLIWGGNETIRAIREAKVQPRCLDLAFADRYSIAVIKADDYLNTERSEEIIALDFYIDSYYTDQNACSSSRMIIWCGDKVEEAKVKFWRALSKIVTEKYEMNDISGSDKLLNATVLAANHPGVRMINESNMLVRVELPSLFCDIMNYKGNSGYFFEYTVSNLDELVPLFGKQCQTITYLGCVEDRLREIINKYGVRGVDRIVPIGHSMDLSFKWDSYDLPIVLSRDIASV